MSCGSYALPAPTTRLRWKKVIKIPAVRHIMAYKHLYKVAYEEAIKELSDVQPLILQQLFIGPDGEEEWHDIETVVIEEIAQ